MNKLHLGDRGEADLLFFLTTMSACREVYDELITSMLVVVVEVV
jgi:hypothetical protein